MDNTLRNHVARPYSLMAFSLFRNLITEYGIEMTLEEMIST